MNRMLQIFKLEWPKFGFYCGIFTLRCDPTLYDT